MKDGKMNPAIRRFLTRKRFLIPVAALLLYTFTGFVIAPFAVRWYVPRYALDQLKCRADIGKVRINPFLFTFEVNEFSLAEQDGSPLARFSRLFLDLEMSGIFQWTTRFREFRLEKPALHVVFEPGGGINLAKLTPRSAAPKDPKSKPFRMILQSVVITGGQVAVTDRRQSKPANLSFQNLNLNLKDFSTIQNRNGSYSFSAMTPKGETVQWQGDISLVPFRSSGRIAFKGIQATTLWKFQRDTVNLEPPAGKLDLSTDYHIDASGTPLQLKLDRFGVDLSKLSLKLIGANKPLIELSKLKLDSARLDLAARAFQVGKLLLNGGMLHLGVDEAGRSNFEKMVRKSPKQEGRQEKAPQELTVAAASPSGQPPWTVKVDAIEVKDIAFTYDDVSRASPLNVGISGIAIRSKAKIEAGAPTTKVSFHEISTELKEVQIGNPQDSEPLFRTGILSVQGGELDLGARSVAVSRIVLTDGTIDFSRNKDGRINWMQLFAPKSGAPDSLGSSSAPGPENPWKFLLKTIELSSFHLAISDRTSVPEKPLFDLQPFNARFTDVDGRSTVGFEVNFQVKQGGTVAVRGKADPGTKSVKADLKAAGLVLTPLQPYLEPYITLVLQSAAVSAQGAFDYGVPGTGAGLVYKGSFDLDKLSLNELGSKKTYLGFDAMHISRLKFTFRPHGLQVGEIKLSKPVCELIIAEDRTVNLSKILKKKAVQEQPSAASKTLSRDSGDPFPFSIGRVRIEKGKMLFADFSLQPQFMIRIHTMKGMISRISSAKDSLTQIQLDGVVDQYGTARITGALNLYNPVHSTDITMVFRNVEMTSLTPYSGKFAGRTIKSGKLSMDLKYQIQNNKLVGNNQIIVDNLLLGERVKSPSAVNLPLDLAVALLKDSSGRIDIGLPVEGDFNDPKFRLAPLIWKAVVNLLTKVVTSPFRALGALFGGGTEKFEAVEFDPGKADLLPPEKEKLKKLADTLQKRPQLKLVVQGRYSPESDGITFKELGVRRAVASRLGEKPAPGQDPGPLDFSDSMTRRALEELYQERFGAPALNEVEQAIKQGTIKPRAATGQKPGEGKRKKKGVFSRVFNNLKLYKIVPGAKSPEESERMAEELYARLVDSEPVSDKTLSQLAQGRAQAIIAEIQSAGGIPENRLASKAPEPLTGKAVPSATFSFDAL
jgi:uncharacterized protein involved in outer membrane biogenesis